MALLLSKMSMLPIVGRNASRSVMAAYFSNTPPAFGRNTPTIVNDDDDTTTDEDEIMNVDQESVVAVTDDGNVIQPVACRVSLPPRRRPWATMQDESALRFRLDMPGIPKDAVKVYIDDARLVVKGKYPPLEEEVDEDHILADNVGMYSAEIELPDNVKTKEIKSEMKDGMLLVTAPKEVLFIPVE